MVDIFWLSTFNGNIENWDVSSVKSFEWAFEDAAYFGGDISGWNVSSATSMYGMLRNVRSNWCVVWWSNHCCLATLEFSFQLLMSTSAVVQSIGTLQDSIPCQLGCELCE